MSAVANAKQLAAEKWFGYGRWDAPYWFVGMEPGGDDTHASYEAWLDLGGDALIDCRAHHQWQLETQGIDNPKWTKYHRRDRSNALQATWRPLILVLLTFKGEPHDTEDVRRYQRDRWGYKNDETAVIELNALHAPSIATIGVDRQAYRTQRIRTIREHLLERPPTFAVFYGQSYQDHYEEMTQAKFDSDGFAQCGRTVCVLAPQPARSGWTNEEWCELGRRLRARSDVVERVV
jgi:hypothetical protein